LIVSGVGWKGNRIAHQVSFRWALVGRRQLNGPPGPTLPPGLGRPRRGLLIGRPVDRLGLTGSKILAWSDNAFASVKKGS
jgi:hypothetical protein